jgi:hypothetical protein
MPRRPPCIDPRSRVLDVRLAELPVLLRLVDAFEKALAMLLLREMQVELDDPGAVAAEVAFQIQDRQVAVMPDALAVLLRVGDVLGPQDHRLKMPIRRVQAARGWCATGSRAAIR